jgi:hypothetical protein
MCPVCGSTNCRESPKSISYIMCAPSYLNKKFPRLMSRCTHPLVEGFDAREHLLRQDGRRHLRVALHRRTIETVGPRSSTTKYRIAGVSPLTMKRGKRGVPWR